MGVEDEAASYLASRILSLESWFFTSVERRGLAAPILFEE
jgi:hypothetical protein